MKHDPHSPTALALGRFFRNRLALTGLVLLMVMVLFSFLGGIFSPYDQHQVFYRRELQKKEVATATENRNFRITLAPEYTLDDTSRAVISLAAKTGEKTVEFGARRFLLTPLGQDLFDLSEEGVSIGFLALDILENDLDYVNQRQALIAYCNGEATPEPISRFLVSTHLGRDFKSALINAIDQGKSSFSLGENEFSIERNGDYFSAFQKLSTQVWDSYAPPSGEHLLGTDKNGMDVLTRLMYGGRVSLLTGFGVVLIAGIFGAFLGAVAGYFGKWTDELLMRLVDVFYCIPTTPLLIILGALMDALRLDFRIRLLWLVLVLGFLGWPPIARIVRGQILSLRQQEFMLAAEALGLTPARRIFRHLLPNVFPQLIVMCTMRLGSTILTEATLSFLGLGIKFPFASWGNILNDAQSVHVLTAYPFVWLPAGICLVVTVLGFNFVGDGLRDALDPKGNA